MFWIRLIVLSCVLLLCGCPSNSQTSQTGGEESEAADAIKMAGPLRVLVLNDPEFAQILRREWLARSENEVEFRDETEANLLTLLQDEKQRLDTDVIIFPTRLLGRLSEGRLLRALPPKLTSASLDSDESSFNLADIHRVVSRKEMQWDRREVAVSLGSPVPMLLTRPDLLPEPPTTWADLDTTIEELKTSLPSGAKAFAQPLGKGWAARLFLSRSAAYLWEPSRVSSFFDYSNMKPQISGAPFVRALEEMQATFIEEDTAVDPSDVFSAFMSGEIAMAITWPHNSITQAEPIAFGIAISELPGTSQQYDRTNDGWVSFEDEEQVRRVTVAGHSGRLAAISRSAKNANSAGNFLSWVAGVEYSSQLCPRSTVSAPFRKSHASTAKNWCDARLSETTVSQYATTLESALTRPEAYVSIRIPGQEKYMNVLDQHVLECLRGDVEAKDALEKVSVAWEKITNELGREKQIAAYRHSLGISVD